MHVLRDLRYTLVGLILAMLLASPALTCNRLALDVAKSAAATSEHHHHLHRASATIERSGRDRSSGEEDKGSGGDHRSSLAAGLAILPEIPLLNGPARAGMPRVAPPANAPPASGVQPPTRPPRTT